MLYYQKANTDHRIDFLQNVSIVCCNISAVFAEGNKTITKNVRKDCKQTWKANMKCDKRTWRVKLYKFVFIRFIWLGLFSTCISGSVSGWPAVDFRILVSIFIVSVFTARSLIRLRKQKKLFLGNWRLSSTYCIPLVIRIGSLHPFHALADRFRHVRLSFYGFSFDEILNKNTVWTFRFVIGNLSRRNVMSSWVESTQLDVAVRMRRPTFVQMLGEPSKRNQLSSCYDWTRICLLGEENHVSFVVGTRDHLISLGQNQIVVVRHDSSAAKWSMMRKYSQNRNTKSFVYQKLDSSCEKPETVGVRSALSKMSESSETENLNFACDFITRTGF